MTILYRRFLAENFLKSSFGPNFWLWGIFSVVKY